MIILVLGEIVEPNIVYTPLVPSQPHYNLYLQSISVNGQALAIDPSVFGTSSNQGTIIDSGTTLAYLAEAAYDPFISAITSIVSPSVHPYLSKGSHCYLMSSSINDIFPQVSLNFAGGASMILIPQDYLIQQSSITGALLWCIGFQKIQGQGITILGDLVLKDKIVVYDIANQRIGWANYDCSMSVNVSTALDTGKSEFVNAGTLSNNGSPKTMLHKMTPVTMMSFLLHMLLLGCYMFL
uniref:Peptidase A1 domain-containing protein n=1 Tax=Salix viminalis TaxID=40686 RepID=A0A6N2MBF2_SALVM